MRRFSANAVAVVEDQELNAFVVVLAEARDGSGQRLELQRAIEFDEQDLALGMDTYCLCTDSGATQYGGVVEWSLEDGNLTVRLDEESSNVLMVDGGFVVLIEDERVAPEDLASGLRRVFRGLSEPPR